MTKNQNLPAVAERGRDENVPLYNPKMTKADETVVITQDQLHEMEVEDTKRIGGIALVDDIRGRVEEIEDLDELYMARLGIEGLRSLLNKALKELDERMFLFMKEKGKKEYESGPENRRVLIYAAQEKKDKVKKSISDLVNRLRKAVAASPDPAAEMIVNTLGTSPSAVKFSQVRTLCDTLGLDQNDYLEVEYKDRIALRYIPKYILERL